MSEYDYLYRDIQKALKAREKADADKRKATKDLAKAILAARLLEMPVTQIANQTSLSRQAVYDLIAEAERPSA